MAIAIDPRTGLRTIEAADVADDTIVITEQPDGTWHWQNVTARATAFDGSGAPAPKLYAYPPVPLPVPPPA